jgi:uncharacterized protein YabE (DUF348 family)
MGAFVKKQGAYFAAGIIGLCLLAGIVYFTLQKPVTILADGKAIHSRVYINSSVRDALKNKNVKIGEYDRVEPSLNSKVYKDEQIVVTRAFKVTVIADGQKQEIITTPVSIRDAIQLAGVKLGEQDVVKTLPVGRTVPDQEIEVIRVTQEEVEVQEAIPCGVERTSDTTLEKGLTRTISAGKDGLALSRVKVTYHNGQEVKRQVVSSKTLQEPRNRVIAMGTITAVSRGSHLLNFREARLMEASAYTYTGYRTATGKTPAVGMVAVDPSVIPMGSRLYIEGYGFAHAADTGGAIKGNRLDLFMEDRSQCLGWGRRTVKVYILE